MVDIIYLKKDKYISIFEAIHLEKNTNKPKYLSEILFQIISVYFRNTLCTRVVSNTARNIFCTLILTTNFSI